MGKEGTHGSGRRGFAWIALHMVRGGFTSFVRNALLSARAHVTGVLSIFFPHRCPSGRCPPWPTEVRHVEIGPSCLQLSIRQRGKVVVKAKTQEKNLKKIKIEIFKKWRWNILVLVGVPFEERSSCHRLWLNLNRLWLWKYGRPY